MNVALTLLLTPNYCVFRMSLVLKASCLINPIMAVVITCFLLLKIIPLGALGSLK